MTRFVDHPVRLTVPATSANLGPGYDSLGMALDLRDAVAARVTDGGLRIEVSGQGEADVPRDESHLVVRAMRTGFEALGVQPPGLALRCENAIPHGRGLGSSSAAIVSGLCLARSLVEDGESLVDDRTLLRIACDIEGHPDNVAPALLGGFVIAGRERGEWYTARCEVDPAIGAVAFVPAAELSTEVARGLIPSQVPHADAAADAGRAALLVAALTDCPEHLFAATRDYLHQEYRRAAMPESLVLVDELRSDSLPAVVSGAGPTVLVLHVSPGPEGISTAELLGRCPDGWTAHRLEISSRGVLTD